MIEINKNVENNKNVEKNNGINMNDIKNIIQQMIFIYNALLCGWTVKMVKNNKFEFRKKYENKREVLLEDYIKKFIEYNININNIIR